MSARLVKDAYGKAAIRLVKVVRNGAEHRIFDCTVEVRLEALRVIARWRDKNTFRALVHVLRDPHPDVRERAIVELRTLGGRESIPALVPCLSDPAASVRAQAVPTLAYLGWTPQTPTDHVLDLMGRTKSVGLLCRLGNPNFA